MYLSSYAFRSGDPTHFDPVSDEIVGQLLSVLESNGVPTDARFEIIMYFYSEWQLLSEAQRIEIRPYLRTVLLASNEDQFKLCYTIVELLGKCYADRAAFDIFSELANSTSEERRALACIGIAFIAENTTELDITRDASSYIESAALDPSEDVRDEALDALDRLTTL